MRKICLFILISLLSLAFLETHQDNPPIEGKSISPCFNKDGKFIFLYEKKGNGILLGERSLFDRSNTVQEKILVEGNANSPFVKKDRTERIWVAWEEKRLGRSDVYFACLEEGMLNNKEKLSDGFDGANLSPSFDFDLEGNPWVTWINNLNGVSRVLVKEMDGGRTWEVNSPSFLSAFTPKIAIDRTNSIWVFWVGLKRGQDEIFYSLFNGYEWSDEKSLNRDSLYPHLTPEVCLDLRGWPWVVWSAYDGYDYEIWLSFWDGCRWSLESKITDNHGASDIYPFITFLEGNIPLIAWSRMSAQSEIFLKYKDGDAWSDEIKIKGDEGFNRKPRLAVLHHNLGLVWENSLNDKSKVKIGIFPFSNLIQKNFLRSTSNSLPLKPLRPFEEFDIILSNPSLDENEYIAFGDSITYGVLARAWFPDKGYVPRLEILLKRRFGPIDVLNRGFPGEQTWEGLARIETVIQNDKSKYLLLMEGTNDMSAGIPSETAAFNTEEMVKKCLQSGVYPIVSTIIPRSDAFWNLVRRRTLDFNKLVRNIPVSHSLPSVDQYRVFTKHPDGYFSLFSDGAHPNELGYQVMAEAWFKEIKKIPWPPIDLKVERKINKLLFYDEHINVVSWKGNPYWAAINMPAQFHIYRKIGGESELNFANVGTVDADDSEFIDRALDPSQTYEYSIQAEDADGVKGPLSKAVRDR